jgi:5-formyltetrahydrofolate cyclo-ligase
VTSKAAIRQRVLATRDALSDNERAAKNAAIRGRVESFDLFQRAGTILLYASFRSEVDTAGLMEGALRQGKRVALPRPRVAERRLEACLITDPGRDLCPGAWGIFEPEQRCQVISIDEIDLAVVPGVVFDESGHRLGYGGGYYDRLLASSPSLPVIGLAFEVQIVTQGLPAEAHDVRLNWIVTEDRMLSARSALSAGKEDL